MELEIGTVVIRGFNLLVWIVLATRIIVLDRPVSAFARKTILLVIVFGMGVLFIGALVPFGIPGPLARTIYTSFTAFSAIAGTSLLTTGEPNGHHRSTPGDDDHPVPSPQ